MRKSRIVPPLPSATTLNTVPQEFEKEPARRAHGRRGPGREPRDRVLYHCARVRSNEVGRNNAEEGGRAGGKNDEGFEEMVKERSCGLSMQPFGLPNGRWRTGERGHANLRRRTLEDENKGKIDR